MLASLALFDQLRQLHPTGTGHLDIEDDRGKLVVKDGYKRLVSTLRAEQCTAAGVENTFERVQIARFVIDKQYLRRFVHLSLMTLHLSTILREGTIICRRTRILRIRQHSTLPHSIGWFRPCQDGLNFHKPPHTVPQRITTK